MICCEEWHMSSTQYTFWNMSSGQYLQATAAPLVGRDVAKGACSLVQVHACMVMGVCSVSLRVALTSSLRQTANEINFQCVDKEDIRVGVETVG
jgi:hypothetical protein